MNKNEHLRSKIIKKLREPRFTEKRTPYKKYNKAKWNWMTIFKEIETSKKNKIPKIIKITAMKYNINYQTLKNKYDCYKNNKILSLYKENRGGLNKIFSEDEERNIFLFIKDNFIDKHRVVCNDIIKIYAKQKFEELHSDKNFNASDGWCNMFKKRWNLSTVKTSISKITSVIYTQEEINSFLEKCENMLVKVGPDFFFNLDQTKWNNINVSLTTIHIKGKQSKINVFGNNKDGFTITLTISYGGNVLIPILTVKGKTELCLKKYDIDKGKILGTYSNNGWVNNKIILIALEQICNHTDGKDSALLLDQFAVHCTEFIKKEAKKRNIELIYVPKGLTYKYQPLDVLIHGILKQKAKYLWRQQITKEPDLKITNADALKHFLKAKEDITPEIIKKSFDKSCFI